MHDGVNLGKAYTAADQKTMIETLKSALLETKKPHYINFATPFQQMGDKAIDYVGSLSPFAPFVPGEDIEPEEMPSRVSCVKSCGRDIEVPKACIEEVKCDPTHEYNTRLIDLLVCEHNKAFLAAFEARVEDMHGKIVSGMGVYDDDPKNRSSWYVGDKTQTLENNCILELLEDKLADFQNEPTVIICNPNIVELLQSLIFCKDASTQLWLSKSASKRDQCQIVQDKLVPAGEFYVAVKSAMKYAYITEPQFFSIQLSEKGYCVQNSFKHKFGFRRNNEQGVLKCFYKSKKI